MSNGVLKHLELTINESIVIDEYSFINVENLVISVLGVILVSCLTSSSSVASKFVTLLSPLNLNSKYNSLSSSNAVASTIVLKLCASLVSLWNEFGLSLIVSFVSLVCLDIFSIAIN